jgi:hypothetical protein
MKHLRQIAAVALIVGVWLVSGCKPPSSKPGFNEELARASFRLQTDSKGFKECLFEPAQATPELMKGFEDPVNLAKVKSYSSKMRTSLKEVKSDIEDLRLPLHSPRAGDTKERYLDYLKAQQDLLDVIDSSVALMEDTSSKLSTAEKRAKITKDFEANREKTKQAWEDFSKAYKEFCESHFFAPR